MLLSAAIIALFEAFGFSIAEAEAVQIAQNLLAIVGIVLNVIGTIDRDDLEWGLWRKEPK